jgi:ATP-binding cassette subfamily B protein
VPTPAPPAPRPRTNPSLRERVGALRNIPPFLREIWATSKPLTIASLGLRLVRALLPIITLYIG